MRPNILLCDIGSDPYVKLALVAPGKRPECSVHYPCTNEHQFDNAIIEFLERFQNPQLAAAGISASGWEEDGVLNLVHFGFKKSRDQLRDMMKVKRLNIVNNFVAKALAVPQLEKAECEQVMGGAEIADQVMSVVGPGRGLGVALLMPDGLGGWTANHCEGGHADLAPANSLEIHVLKVLMERFGHVSYERAVSDEGMINLWDALDVVEGPSGHKPELKAIIDLSRKGNERARMVIRLFTEIFATLASDVALFNGSRGGVYLTGEVLDQMGDQFDADLFAKRFYDKGRVSGFLREIPVFRVRRPEPEILGLSTLYEVA